MNYLKAIFPSLALGISTYYWLGKIWQLSLTDCHLLILFSVLTAIYRTSQQKSLRTNTTSSLELIYVVFMALCRSTDPERSMKVKKYFTMALWVKYIVRFMLEYQICLFIESIHHLCTPCISHTSDVWNYTWKAKLWNGNLAVVRFCQNPTNPNLSVKQFYVCSSLQLNKGQAKNQEKGHKTGPSFQSLNSNFKMSK